MLPYAKYFPLLFPIILLLLGYFHPISALNQDLGRHLLTGQIITQTLQIPSTNLFSYTYPEFPFINHHWFSEVVFSAITSVSGYPGLFIFSLLLIVSAFGLVLSTAANTGRIIPLAFLAIIYLRILFERTDLRPELLSFLFMSLMITILYRYREKYTRLIVLLIPLQLLWTNSHIYFPIGILVTVLFAIDLGFLHRKNLRTTQIKLLIITLFGMGLVTLINPHGLTGALYPFTVMQNYGYTIEENQTPFFLQSLGFVKPSLLYLEIALLILFSSLLATIKRFRLIDWLLATVFSAIALSAVRNFPLFVFATLIPCSYAVSTCISSFSNREKQSKPLMKYLALTCLLLFFCWQARAVVAMNPIGYGVHEDAKAALDFVKKEGLKGSIFNNFDIGSYIESRLYPDEKVFIDGRPEAYPASFIKNVYIPMQEDKALFASLSNKYNFNTIIFSHTDQTPWGEQFVNTIVQDDTWRTVYLDPTIIVLVKNIPKNESLIKRFSLAQSLSMTLPDDERLLRQAAHFYSITSQTISLEKVISLLLQRSPNNCQLLNAMMSMYAKDNHPSTEIYQARYRMHCSD